MKGGLFPNEMGKVLLSTPTESENEVQEGVGERLCKRVHLKHNVGRHVALEWRNQ